MLKLPTCMLMAVGTSCAWRLELTMETPRETLVPLIVASAVPEPLGRWGHDFSLNDQDKEQEMPTPPSATPTPEDDDMVTALLPITRLRQLMLDKEYLNPLFLPLMPGISMLWISCCSGQVWHYA